MRIDLHTHSDASDGTDRPGDLVRNAKGAGLDVVALTDHDTDAGWAEAQAAALEVGLDLVRGMEISTKHHGKGVHLLAYLPDPTYPGLADRLGRIIEGRTTRIPVMIDRLAAAGVMLDPASIRRPANGPVGRPHVADAIVAAGHAVDRTEAFREFLGYGKPGYVDRYAPELTEMIGVVKEAGGVTVVAHAWGRHGPGGLPERDVAALVEAGLSGLEIDHEDHDMDARRQLVRIGRAHDLVLTGSSDYHGLGKIDHDLGCHLTDSDEYARLLERAAAAAAASVCAPPGIVRA